MVDKLAETSATRIACHDIRRSHESQKLTSLDDAINIAKEGLWLLRLSVLDGDCDALPAEAANIGVGELGVVTANHLFNVGHFAVSPAILQRRRQNGWCKGCEGLGDPSSMAKDVSCNKGGASASLLMVPYDGMCAVPRETS